MVCVGNGAVVVVVVGAERVLERENSVLGRVPGRKTLERQLRGEGVSVTSLLTD